MLMLYSLRLIRRTFAASQKDSNEGNEGRDFLTFIYFWYFTGESKGTSGQLRSLWKCATETTMFSMYSANSVKTLAP